MQSCGVHCGDCNVNIYYLPLSTPYQPPPPKIKRAIIVTKMFLNITKQVSNALSIPLGSEYCFCYIQIVLKIFL